MPVKSPQDGAFRLVTLLMFLALPAAHGQTPKEAKGAVCTGVFAPFYPHSKHSAYLTVGDSEKLYFDHPETVVLGNLDLHKTYLVRVFEDGEEAHSWKLRFDRLKVHMVTIWRSPGYWHMDPNPSGKCGER